ncbi:methyltransferase domain-containing protein, partial [Streptomyces galbus]
IIEGDGRETGAHFLPGSFDVVLCHGVLMYLQDPDALLAGRARGRAPGGLLSLLVRHGDAPAVRPGRSGDRAGAPAAPVLRGRRLRHSARLATWPHPSPGRRPRPLPPPRRLRRSS